MTNPTVGPSVLSEPCVLSNSHRTSAVVGHSGALEGLTVDDISVLLYPATPLADGLAGMWLRRRDEEGVRLISLIGQTTPTRPSVDGNSPADRSGHWGDLSVAMRLRLSDERPAWFWHLEVTNQGAEPVEVDVLHAQDVALAPLGAVRTNEYYVSQYLDLSPVEVPGHGTAIGVRQNMPGPTPWLLVGCLGRADRWATDALQLTGRGRPDATAWKSIDADLPACRLQGEHSVAALQTEPIVLQPQQRWTTGFFGVYLSEHQEATSDADARHAEAALRDPAATPPDRVTSASTAHGADHRSWFGTATPVPCRALTDSELDRWTGPDRHQAEHDGDDLLSYFTAAGAHVVTRDKQARVLRPHGQVFRSGSRLLPEEASVCATVWMDGTFCSHLTQGHVHLGAIMSARRSYLGLAPAHGLRIFVRQKPGDDWLLLGTPSAWSVTLQEARWWYATDTSVVEVSTRVPAESDTVDIEVAVLDGPPIEILAAADFPWLDPDSPPGSTSPLKDGVRIQPAPGSPTSAMFPDGSVRLQWGRDTTTYGDDGPLFLDDRPRGLPWVTLRTGPTADWRLSIIPELVQPDARTDRDADFWSTQARAVRMRPPRTAAGDEMGRIATVLPWFTHNALIHFLSPRGLEQYTGGAWGTRDVSQGPVALLLSLGADAELRSVILMIMRAQNVRGDWPQAFDFLERHHKAGQSDAHGDVPYWPLLALGQYLAATGDGTILSEEVPFTGDDGPTPPASVADHVHAALDHIAGTMIAGTAMPAYGHGDWNDSLQPADPRLAAQLCSTWTVVLQAHALRTLGTELERHGQTRQLGQRARAAADAGVADLRRLLLVDGVLAGYGLFPELADQAPGPVEPLIHPLDERTGLHYSILPMIHAISADLLTPDEARAHLQLITEHLLGADGARLFDQPVTYAGGPMTMFQRAEASTFFGREIGIMYVHAHLRYAEALARVGDGTGLLRALAVAQPVGITDRVPSARPRQSTCYYSSSDAQFADRYTAHADYHRVVDGSVAFEGGWRVYSSGPGLFLQVVVQHQLGLRVRGDDLEIDPVLDPDLDGLLVDVPLLGTTRTVRYSVGPRGHGVVSVKVGGVTLPDVPLTNPYRRGGVSIRANDLRTACTDTSVVVEIETG